MGIDARRSSRASKMRYQPTTTHSIAERRHSEEPGTQSAAQRAGGTPPENYALFS